MLKSNGWMSIVASLGLAAMCAIIPSLLGETKFNLLFGWVLEASLIDQRVAQIANLSEQSARVFQTVVGLSPLLLIVNAYVHAATSADWKKRVEKQHARKPALFFVAPFLTVPLLIAFLLFLPIFDNTGSATKIAILFLPAVSPLSLTMAVTGIYFAIAAPLYIYLGK